MNKSSFHIIFKSLLLIFIVSSIGNNSFGQKKRFLSDSVHSPRKATIYSAILPGLGQYYNEKSWKIPIVYAAIGGCLTAAIINNKDYNSSRNELLYRQACSGQRLNEDYRNFEDTQLLELSNYSRKWRDNMFIFTGVAYALNIIDANVDAHLFNFNVDDNLSMNVMPYTYSQEFSRPVAGVSLRFNFK